MWRSVDSLLGEFLVHLLLSIIHPFPELFLGQSERVCEHSLRLVPIMPITAFQSDTVAVSTVFFHHSDLILVKFRMNLIDLRIASLKGQNILAYHSFFLSKLSPSSSKRLICLSRKVFIAMNLKPTIGPTTVNSPRR